MHVIVKVLDTIRMFNPFAHARHYEYVGYGIMRRGTDPVIWTQDYGGE